MFIIHELIILLIKYITFTRCNNYGENNNVYKVLKSMYCITVSYNQIPKGISIKYILYFIMYNNMQLFQ